MPNLKKYILMITFALGLLVPTAVFAMPSGFTNWNNKTVPPSASGDFCTELFKGDPDNFYQENICSLMRVISGTTVDFASKITCEIQKTPDRANYKDTIDFAYTTGGQCAPSKGLGAVDNIFGEKSSKSGFYDFTNNRSQLTNSIIAPQTSTTTTKNTSVQNVFEATRNITTVLAFLVLIIVAFANILHYDINTYAVKKALPTLFIALVGGWLSIYAIYLVSRLIDVSYSLTIFSPYQALHPMQNIFGGTITADPSNALSAVSQVFGASDYLFNLKQISFVSAILGTIFLLIPAIVVFVFEYLMALRPLVVGILTAVSPIAFLTLLLPQTQFLFKKWWTILLIALFYAPLVNFVFYIMNTFSASANPTSAPVALVLMLFKTAVLVFLIRLPFTFESDWRNLSYKISKTGLGEALRLKKGQAKSEGHQTGGQTISDKILQTPQAEKIIAGIEGRRSLTSASELRRLEKVRSKPYFDRSTLPDLPEMFAKANTANFVRSSSILSQSVSDLTPETFKNVIRQSDFRVWQNPSLVSELKNKNGQVLDDQGAAIRADAARKLVRLSQIVEGDKIQNPEAIKALAQKGVLDNIPLAVVKKAIQDGVLTKNDLIPTYQNQSGKVFDRLQTLDLKKSELLSSSQAKILMNQDQKDYSTGFKDMVGLFSNVVKDNKVMPPPPTGVIKDIISQMKTHGSDTFESNGMYFLDRLGKVQNNAQNTVVSNLQKAGAPISTAIAIAKNPRVDLEEAKKYIKPEAVNAETLGMLREGFINRDLSNSLISEIANQVSSQKTAVSDAICGKLADNLKTNQTSSFDEIKKSLESYLNQKNPSPEGAKSFATEVGKYVPGSNIAPDGEISSDAIVETKKHAKSVLDVIEGLSRGGVDEKTLSSNPQKAKTVLKSQISQDIQKTVSGQISADKTFTQELNKFSPPSNVSVKPETKLG